MSKERLVISGDMASFCDGCSSVNDCLIKLAELKGKEECLEELKLKLVEIEKKFIEKTKTILSDVFDVEYLETGDIKRQFRDNIESELRNGNIVISLDRNYIKYEDFSPELRDRLIFLDCTRLEKGGVVERPGTPSLDLQYQNILEKVKKARQKIPNSKIVMVDDVLFSGGTVLNINKELQKLGIEINKSLFAVSVENAGGKNNLEKSSISVNPIKVYETLKDEICSRDFIYGLPQSGRLAEIEGERVLKPYFSPFGNSENASIPKSRELAFAKACVDFSSEFWTEIDKYRTTPISVAKLPYNGKPYIPNDLKQTKTEDVKQLPITEVLRRAGNFVDAEISRRQTTIKKIM